MAAITMTIIATFIFTAVLWLSIGSRFSLSTDGKRNDLKNLMAYFATLFPLMFVLVFFVVERI